MKNDTSQKKKKICIICGGFFYPSIYNKKICSDECRLVRRRQWFRKYMKKYYVSNLSYHKNYFKKNREKFKKNKKRWNKTKKGRENQRRNRSKYKYKCKGKNWIPILPNIFPDNISVDYHHVDGKWFVVPLPTEVHRSTSGKLSNHIQDSNEWVDFFYDFNVDDFLNDDLTVIEK